MPVDPEVLEAEARSYFNDHLVNPSCNCEDCSADRYPQILPDLFRRFSIPFVPSEYEQEGSDYKWGSTCNRFMSLWGRLFDLKTYNENMEKKKEQSESTKSLLHCAKCGKLTYKNKNRTCNDGQLCITCAKYHKTCHYCGNLGSTDRYAPDALQRIEFARVGDDSAKHIYVCGSCYDFERLFEHKCANCALYVEKTTQLVKVIHTRNNDDKIIYRSYCPSCGRDLRKCSVLGCTELTFNGCSECMACAEEEIGLHSYDYKPIRRYS